MGLNHEIKAGVNEKETKSAKNRQKEGRRDRESVLLVV